MGRLLWHVLSVVLAVIQSATIAGCGADDPAPQPSTASTRCVQVTSDASTTIEEDPRYTAVARMMVSSAENSSLAWEQQYGYIEYDVEGDADENRGYTAGLVGFTSKTHDMLELVREYTRSVPDNPIARFLPALEQVDGTSSAKGLGDSFVAAWKQAATTSEFQQAQRDVADRLYLHPAVAAARADGLGRLGQFVYYDAIVVHGPGSDAMSFGGIRSAARAKARTPAQGGDETTYLRAFLEVRRQAMEAERAHQDTTRVDAQETLLEQGNLSLALPLRWSVYGDEYVIAADGSDGC